MKFAMYRQFVVFLAVVHLTLCVGGEALHLLPGMGHYEDLGNGVLIWHGGERPCKHLPCGPAGSEGALTSNDDDGKILDEDDCPICSLVSQVYSRGQSTPAVVSLPFWGELALALPPSVFDLVAVSYDTRAPPRATSS